MSSAVLIAGFDDPEKAERALDGVDAAADAERYWLCALGLISGTSTTTTIVDTTIGLGSVGRGPLLQVLLGLARSSQGVPAIGGVIWGLAAGIGRAANDNLALRALVRAVDEGRSVLVAVAELEVLESTARVASVDDAAVHPMPDETSRLIDLVTDLSLDDVTNSLAFAR